MDDDADFPGSQAAWCLSLFGGPHLVEITGPAERMFDDSEDSFPITFTHGNKHTAGATYYEMRCKLVPIGPVASSLLEVGGCVTSDVTWRIFKR
jgi:hypothetical protein